MKMLSLKSAETQVVNCRPGDQIVVMRFLTFKRDRGIRLTVNADGCLFEEHRYANEQIQLADHAAYKKAVKEAFRREFPRSHQVCVDMVRR